jgi:hypothetical protein
VIFVKTSFLGVLNKDKILLKKEGWYQLPSRLLPPERESKNENKRCAKDYITKKQIEKKKLEK